MRKEDSEQQLFSLFSFNFSLFPFFFALLSFLFCIACTSAGGPRGERGIIVKEVPHIEADIEVFPQLGHSDGVRSVVFSPWDIASGMELKAFTCDTASIEAFSPDGNDNGVYCFFPSDTVFTSGGKFDIDSVINIDELTRALDIPGRKIVMLDTCESGGVDTNQLVHTLRNRKTALS